jgi:hypothetical protein
LIVQRQINLKKALEEGRGRGERAEERSEDQK